MKRLLSLILVLLATTALYGCDLIGNVPTTYALNGDSEITLEVGATYTELGTTYPTPEDVVITGTVDTSTIGVYTITYEIPLENNATLNLSRTINVVDTTIPTITLIGGEVNLQVGGAFIDPGATANDNYDGDISADIVVSGTVNVNAVGSYVLTYNVSDSSGNAATPVTRTVIVGESELDNPPVITLTGAAVINLYVGETFTDPGATASDIEDGNITASIVVTGTVNTATAGSYTLSFTNMSGFFQFRLVSYPTVDVPNTMAEAQTLVLGDAVVTRVYDALDEDWFEVNLTEQTELSGLVDMYYEIYDTTDTLIYTHTPGVITPVLIDAGLHHIKVYGPSRMAYTIELLEIVS